jgi:hypothetical protein
MIALAQQQRGWRRYTSAVAGAASLKDSNGAVFKVVCNAPVGKDLSA